MSPASPPQQQAVGRAAEGDFHLQSHHYSGGAAGALPQEGQKKEVGGVPAGPLPSPKPQLPLSGGLPALTQPWVARPSATSCHLLQWGPSYI